MIQQTIDELREMKSSLEKSAKKYDLETSDIETLNKAIIACEQLQKARKKAKRWKRKYLDMQAVVDERADYERRCDVTHILENMV